MGSGESWTGPDSEFGKQRPWTHKGWLKSCPSWLINSITGLEVLGAFTSHSSHPRDKITGGNDFLEEGFGLVCDFGSFGPWLLNIIHLGKHCGGGNMGEVFTF